MSLAQRLGLPTHQIVANQTGGYVKGQRLETDNDGNRIFIVNLLNEKNERNPLYVNADESTGEIKIFKGKEKQLPEQVATKVVTEICRLLRKNDPNAYKNWCQPVTSADMTKREQDLLKNKDQLEKLDLRLYPGFRFELVDTLNTRADGKNRTYLYYGERHKLDEPKKHKGSKFMYESHVVPIRRNFTLEQALLDHYFKSKKAKKREITKGNLVGQGGRKKKTESSPGHRLGTLSGRGSRRSSPSSNSRSGSGGRGSSLSMSPKRLRLRTQLLTMPRAQLQQKCKVRGKESWKVGELNELLTALNLSRSGLKGQKCRRVLDYHARHVRK